eukprot:COSAG03_NODE_1779_length_3534_cov_4.827074_6_plen_56_part_00
MMRVFMSGQRDQMEQRSCPLSVETPDRVVDEPWMWVSRRYELELGGRSGSGALRT